MNSRTLKFFGITAALTALALFVVRSSDESSSSKPTSSAPLRRTSNATSVGNSHSDHSSTASSAAANAEPSDVPTSPQVPPLPQSAFNLSVAGNEQPLVASAPDTPPTTSSIVAVAPDTPGNFFTTLDRTVRVSSIERTLAGDSLNVLISESRESDPALSDTPASSQPIRTGFTYEQELFRTKWGWAAFNRVNGTVTDDSITTP